MINQMVNKAYSNLRSTFLPVFTSVILVVSCKNKYKFESHIQLLLYKIVIFTIL